MEELTLESLAARVAALEKKLAEQATAKPEPKKDWRRTIGMFADNEFIEKLDETVAEMREAERKAVRGEASE